jgi:Protein of unknown function (DUF1236)
MEKIMTRSARIGLAMALLLGGTTIAMAQNGPPTGGYPPARWNSNFYSHYGYSHYPRYYGYQSISNAPELRAPQMNCPVRTPSFLAAAAAVIGLIGLCTFAEHVQAQVNAPPAVAPVPRLKLTTEQEFIIREIILKDLNVPKENSAPETIGDSVPDDVKLYPLPPEVIQKVPQAQAHQFFVKDDEVVLVSSSDRRVADVIKKKPTD